MKIVKVIIVVATVVLAYIMLPNGISAREPISAYADGGMNDEVSGREDFAGTDYIKGDTVNEKPLVKATPEEIRKVLELKEEGKDGFWDYMSDGQITTRNEAKSDAMMWKGMQTEITVPVWVMSKSGEKTEKKQVVRCNKKAASIFKAAFEDIFASPEKPVIDFCGAYVMKGSGGGGGLSAHAMGLAMDLNVTQNPCYYSDGTVVGGNDAYSVKGEVVTKTMYDTVNVDEATKARVFYTGGSVVDTLVEKYSFKWGALFGYASPGGGDRMHFSLGGDGPWRDRANDYMKNGKWSDYYAGK